MSDISKARVKGVVYDIKDERARNLVEQHELAIQEILENYARMDGYYETMGVGVATNLKGSNTSVAKFVYRKSGGSESVDSGLAQLTEMRGKSVVWNQIVLAREISSSSGLTFTLQENRIFVSGTATQTMNKTISVVISYIGGHKYLFLPFFQAGTSYTYTNFAAKISPYEKGVYTCPADIENFIYFHINSGDTFDNTDITVNIVDLTLMFGAGNEPSTVEEFEAMFPNGYYPYNTGSLLNFNAESLKTVGFNQWDEEWEVGAYNLADGTKMSDDVCIRSKNLFQVIAGTSYFLKAAGARFLWYDENEVFVDSPMGLANTVYMIPDNVHYGAFYKRLSPTTYNHDICINISDPSKNGTYEPYWESNLPLNIKTQTGKLNGSGESIVVFPDGMAGMNGVQDTIIGNTATKKFMQVNDLTTLPITLNYEGYAPEEESGDTVYSFILELPKNAKAFTASVMNGLFNNKYSASYGISAASSNNFYIYTLQGKSYVEIMDSTFATDVRFADEEQWDALIADIRTSLADKMLLYELSVQEEYILDGIELPLNYKVDKNGTEQIIPNTSDPDNNIPSTTPCDMDIVYSIDAANTIINLPNNYVSATQQQSFSASQQAQARANIGLSNVATKYKTTIQGDGNNEYTITHNLSSTSVFVVVQDASTLEQISGYQVIADSANQIRIVFNEEIGVGVTYNILILS